MFNGVCIHLVTLVSFFISVWMVSSYWARCWTWWRNIVFDWASYWGKTSLKIDFFVLINKKIICQCSGNDKLPNTDKYTEHHSSIEVVTLVKCNKFRAGTLELKLQLQTMAYWDIRRIQFVHLQKSLRHTYNMS